MAKTVKAACDPVTPNALADWRAKSPAEREIARLDDAIRAVEALVAERAARAALPAGRLPDSVVAQIARRADVPRAQAGRVLRALQEFVAEQAPDETPGRARAE